MAKMKRTTNFTNEEIKILSQEAFNNCELLRNTNSCESIKIKKDKLWLAVANNASFLNYESSNVKIVIIFFIT